jgi:hypothetical protein
MSLEISEDVVSLAYQNLGYFVIEGRQVGHGEIDLLGVKLGADGQIEKRVHIEVQIGVNPIGVLGGKQGGLEQNREPLAAAEAWIDRKYRADRIEAAVKAAFGGQRPDRVFVHGKMKDCGQLEAFKRAGIECVEIGRLVHEAEEKGCPRNRLHRTVEIARLLTAQAVVKDRVKVSDSR